MKIQTNYKVVSILTPLFIGSVLKLSSYSVAFNRSGFSCIKYAALCRYKSYVIILICMCRQ